MGGSDLKSVPDVDRLLKTSTRNRYCSWLLEYRVVGIDESYIWKATGRLEAVEFAALLKTLVDLLLAGPCQYVAIIFEPAEPTFKLAQRQAGKGLDRRSAVYAEHACQCLAGGNRAAAAAHVVNCRSVPVARRVKVLKAAMAEYVKQGQVFMYSAVQETDLAMPQILLELGKLLQVGKTDMVMLCDDYDFLLHPARLATARFVTDTASRKGPRDALVNPMDPTVMEFFDIQQITAGLFWVQPAAAAGGSSSSSGVSGSSTMAAELECIVPLTLLVLLSEDCGVKQQLPAGIGPAKVWRAAKAAYEHLLSTQQDSQQAAGGLAMAFIDQLLDQLYSQQVQLQEQLLQVWQQLRCSLATLMLAIATQSVAVPTDLQSAAQLQQVELLLPNNIQELETAVKELSATLSATDKLAQVQLSVSELGAAQINSTVVSAARFLSGAVMTVCGAVVDLDAALLERVNVARMEFEQRLLLQPMLLKYLQEVCQQLSSLLEQRQVPQQQQPQQLQHSGQQAASGLQQQQQQQQQEQQYDELLQKIMLMVGEQLEPLARYSEQELQQQQQRTLEFSNGAVALRLTTHAGTCLLVNQPTAEQLGLPSQLFSSKGNNGSPLSCYIHIYSPGPNPQLLYTLRATLQWTASRLDPLLAWEGWDQLQRALLQQVAADTVAGLKVYLRRMDEAGSSSSNGSKASSSTVSSSNANSSNASSSKGGRIKGGRIKGGSSKGGSSKGSSSSISNGSSSIGEYKITLHLVSSLGAELPYDPQAVAAAAAAAPPTIVRLPLQPPVVLVPLSTQPSETCLAFSRQEYVALQLERAVLRHASLPGGRLQPLPCAQGMLQQRPSYVALWQDGGQDGCQLVGLLRVGESRFTNCSALKQQVHMQHQQCLIRHTILDPRLETRSEHQLQFCKPSKLLDPSILRSFQSSSSRSPGKKRGREAAEEQPTPPKKGPAAAEAAAAAAAEAAANSSSSSIISKLNSSSTADPISSSMLCSSSATFPLLALQAVVSPHEQAELQEVLKRNPIFIHECDVVAKRACRPKEQLLNPEHGCIAHLMVEVIVGPPEDGLPDPAAPVAAHGLLGRKYGLAEQHDGRPHSKEQQQSTVIYLTTNTTNPCGGESCSTTQWQQPNHLVPPSPFSRASGLEQMLEGDVPVYAALYCSSAIPQLLAVLPVTGGHTQQPVAGRVVKTANGRSPMLPQATGAHCALLWAGLHFALSERGEQMDIAAPDRLLPALLLANLDSRNFIKRANKRLLPALLLANFDSSDVIKRANQKLLPALLLASFDSSYFIKCANKKPQELKASVHCTVNAVTDCASPLFAVAEADARKDQAVQERLQLMKQPLECVRAAPLLVSVSVILQG